MSRQDDGKNRFGGDPSSGRGRPPTNGSNGHHGTNGTNGVNGAHSLDVPTVRLSQAQLNPHLHDDGDEPVDLVAVHADDELISALSIGTAVSSAVGGGYSSDDHVSAILAAWKAEVDAEPMPELIDLDAAVAAVRSSRPRSGRIRHLAPVAAAAAFIVLTVGGLGVGSYSATPDDVLWPVSKVLYAERADSLQAADRVEERIAKAKEAIANGQPNVAEAELRAAAADLAAVRPQEGKDTLAEVQEFLVRKAGETSPGVPTDPGAPLAADQARKVPPGASLGTSATPSSSPAVTSNGSSTSPQSGTSTSRGSDPSDRSGVPDPLNPLSVRIPGPVDPGLVPGGSPVTPVEPDPESSEPEDSSPTTAPDDPNPPGGGFEGPVGGFEAPPADPVLPDVGQILDDVTGSVGAAVPVDPSSPAG